MAKTFAQLRNKLDGYLAHHLGGLENDERVEALGWYCQGLSLEVPDKTLCGIAERLMPEARQGGRQRMQRALQRGRFSHEDVFARLQRTVFRTSAKRVAAYCLDDTGFEKKGDFSVGVQRQYSGTLGRVGNCQVAVSLHAVNDDFSACLGAQLYLPSDWAADADRRARAKVPAGITFQPKTAIALSLLRAARDNDAPKRPVVADAGYGDSRAFRDEVTALGLPYVVAISSNTTVWPPGSTPGPAPRKGSRGPHPRREEDPNGMVPVGVHALAQELWNRKAFRKLTWRRGSSGPMQSQFCAVRVRSAERRTKGQPASAPIWLLLERDDNQPTRFRYYFSSLPGNTPVRRMVRLAKMRWRIERDYQDMKQKLGLDQYEGRQWGGFHRHFAMVALMHAFLSLYRESFSPSESRQRLDVARLLPRIA